VRADCIVGIAGNNWRFASGIARLSTLAPLRWANQSVCRLLPRDTLRADFHDLLWHTSPTARNGITFSLNRLAAVF